MTMTSRTPTWSREPGSCSTRPSAAHRAELAFPMISKRTQGATATMRVVTAGNLSLVEMAQLNRDFSRIFRMTRGQLACAAARAPPLRCVA